MSHNDHSSAGARGNSRADHPLHSEKRRNLVHLARFRRELIASGAFLALGAVVTSAATLPQNLNHTFDVNPANVTVCTDGATFTGETTQPSSVGPTMTSQVFESTGTTVLATGNTHVFTSVGESFTFTVMGSFTLGDLVVVTVTDVPGTVQGVEGDAATATVGNCSIAVPTMPSLGLGVFALVLFASGAILAARKGSPLRVRGRHPAR